MPPSAPVPRLRWLYEDRGWVALCFDDVDGRHPDQPWTDRDLALVVPALGAMAAALTPSPVAVQATAARGFERDIKGWGMALDRGEARLDPWAVRNLERVAGLEPRAPGEVAGDTLLHFDTRATTS